MKLAFLGAAGTVTGSRTLVTHQGKQLLVDCGLFQGYKNLRLMNWEPFPFDPRRLDAVVLTHAHLDHSGALPLLVKQGFRGPVFATPGTLDVCEVLLPDSGRLQEEDAEYANRHQISRHKPALPLYTEEDAERALRRIEPLPFGRVLHHLKAMAPDRRNTIVFAGYQAGGTRGARMVAGERSIRIHGEEVAVNAEIVSLPGMSAHADARQIVQWLATAPKPPRSIYLNHGEPGPADALRQRIEHELGWSATAPRLGQTLELQP